MKQQVIKKNFYKRSSTCQIPGLEVFYQQFFGLKKDGCFVEIGAFDGEYVSNTSGLADIGWKGFYIEPVPEFYEKCIIRHKKNTNVKITRAAVGDKHGEVEINVGGPLSTISDEMKIHFNTLAWAKGTFSKSQKVKAPLITLNSYLEENEIKPNFELLVIDVEGFEWNVLRKFDIDKYFPQMVIIELHDQNDDYLLIRDQCKMIVKYFDEHDYLPIYKDKTNTIYIRKDFNEDQKHSWDYSESFDTSMSEYQYPLHEHVRELYGADRLSTKYNEIELLIQNKDFDNAENLLCEILDSNPNDAIAFYKLGELYKMQNDFYEALIIFEKAFKINPASKEIGLKLAEFYSELNREKERKLIYEKLFEIYTEDPELKALYTISTQLSSKQEIVPFNGSRIDYFIIWGNGLRYKDAILEIIRESDYFKILSITDHKIGNIDEFIFKLYKPDPVPWEHLVAKTKYILNTPPKITVIIVENKNPREKYFGEGEFRHIQCEKIKFIKEYIRNIYNPRKERKRTEEHVIHGSDFEKQTIHLLKILNLGNIEDFKTSNRLINIPYHLPPIRNFIIKKVEIDKIFCKIITGNDLSRFNTKYVPISESPHYHYTIGDKEKYNNYFELYGGKILKDDHTPNAFDKLIKDFNCKNSLENGNYILLKQEKNGSYKILDGLHRAAILLSQNEKTIIAAVT